MTDEQGAAGVDAVGLPDDWKTRYWTKKGLEWLYPRLTAGCKSYKEVEAKTGIPHYLVNLVKQTADHSSVDGVYQYNQEQGKFRPVVMESDPGWFYRGEVHPMVELACTSMNACTGIPTTDLSPGLVQQLQGQVKALSEELEKARAEIGRNRETIAFWANQDVNLAALLGEALLEVSMGDDPIFCNCARVEQKPDGSIVQVVPDYAGECLACRIRIALGTQPTGAADQEG